MSRIKLKSKANLLERLQKRFVVFVYYYNFVMYLDISRSPMFITSFLDRLYFLFCFILFCFVFVFLLLFLFLYIEGIHIYTRIPIKRIYKGLLFSAKTMW